MAQANSQARELLHWSSQQRALVEERLHAVHAQWRLDWGLAPDVLPLNTGMSLSDAQAQRNLATELFGPVPMDIIPLSIEVPLQPGLAQSVVDEAWNNWLARLQSALGMGALPQGDFLASRHKAADSAKRDFWGGNMTVAFTWRDGQWLLGLPGPAVIHLLGEDYSTRPVALPEHLPALVRLESALAQVQSQLKVSVHFEPIVLTLGQIEGLRIGDVLPLQHPLDEPVAISVCVGSGKELVLCDAWMGQHQGRMAVELASGKASASR